MTADNWTQRIEMWQRARWLPIGRTVYFHYAPGSGPFHGWCWRVVSALNGRPDPVMPEGCGWALKRSKAVARAQREINRDNERDANERAAVFVDPKATS